ncbi:RagB/SusD family nutrient uptake outer membrane protein [Sphingobacterium sp. SYP-B4668]|uniref:RagB/SusD family nutrient uptake outer membrane protein n=1 Tax=Sphingobacterium sp. SYP-B4668 TaxID=2996035 RepID=UPI0022DE4ED9|nr:RagB/SusD family nutrient uptake outer membrane protein [Sphingobacterium sp. SYP-B4668]
MKIYITGLLLIAGLLSFTSCSDFLDEEPKYSIPSQEYYKTETQARANVNALYRRGAPQRYSDAASAYVGPNASIPTMLTGYFTNSYEGQELVCLYAKELTRQQHTSVISPTMNSIWDSCYAAINTANGAIKYIPGIKMEAANVDKLVAEAKFFRAYNYFYLIKTFGDVPLVVEPYEKLENLYPERNTTASVYAVIEADLKEAVEKLPATTFLANARRITKYAAAMALANVYLQQNKFAEAATYAKIVTSSAHKLTPNGDYGTNSAFNKLRTTDDLDEVIYAQEFDAGIRNSSWWPTYAFSSSATAVFTSYSIFERVFGPTDRFLNVYGVNDLRIKPNQFFHWEYTHPTTGKKWTSQAAGVWYYFDEAAVLGAGQGTKDWNFYRFSEALLIAAEAIAKSTGVTAEAAGYLAQVRSRADVTGKTVAEYTSELQVLSVDRFVEECWTERLRELPLEFKMWDDCLRTGKFPVISPTEKGKVEYQTLIGAKNGFGATFKESDLLWPISPDELQRNKSLKQNPGYN